MPSTAVLLVLSHVYDYATYGRVLLESLTREQRENENMAVVVLHKDTLNQNSLFLHAHSSSACCARSCRNNIRCL